MLHPQLLEHIFGRFHHLLEKMKTNFIILKNVFYQGSTTTVRFKGSVPVPKTKHVQSRFYSNKTVLFGRGVEGREGFYHSI